jgi:hypothetical protein
VGGTLFRVNERIIDGESDKTKALLARTAERLDGVIVLEDATALDFDRFLEALYCRYVRFDGV